MSFALDSRLKNDSHPLLIWGGCHIRLNRNASLPWFLIIPETAHLEFHDLRQTEQQRIMHLTQILVKVIKQDGVVEKINFAAIGNVVSQLHIHVIGRHSQDPLWPDVVWGRSLPAKDYTEEQMHQITQKLQEELSS